MRQTAVILIAAIPILTGIRIMVGTAMVRMRVLVPSRTRIAMVDGARRWIRIRRRITVRMAVTLRVAIRVIIPMVIPVVIAMVITGSIHTKKLSQDPLGCRNSKNHEDEGRSDQGPPAFLYKLNNSFHFCFLSSNIHRLHSSFRTIKQTSFRFPLLHQFSRLR